MPQPLTATGTALKTLGAGIHYRRPLYCAHARTFEMKDLVAHLRVNCAVEEKYAGQAGRQLRGGCERTLLQCIADMQEKAGAQFLVNELPFDKRIFRRKRIVWAVELDPLTLQKVSDEQLLFAGFVASIAMSVGRS
jgi:hypothetical protein